MYSFGGVDAPQSPDPRIAVVPCGYEGTTTFYAGTRFGPRRLLEASSEIELFDLEVGVAPFDIGIVTRPEIELLDRAEDMIASLQTHLIQELGGNRFPLLLGGEHTIAIAGATAAAERFKDLGIVQIDAHADFRDTYHGNKLNHACVGRRLAELAPLTQLGIRSMSRAEHVALKSRQDVTVFPAYSLTADWPRKIVDALPETVYLSVDLDGLDPSLLPGVGNPEPGGITWNDLSLFLEVLFSHRQVVGADLCELCPQPGSPVSESVAARIALRICSLYAKYVVAHRRG